MNIINVKGTGIPKTENDQNTDDIIHGMFLNEITFAEMGKHVYETERYEDGQLVKEHPFNDPRYQGAKILIAGDNYGTGSSREHAPQALKGWGIDGTIAVSYAGIFADNCQNIGLVGVTVNSKQVSELAESVRNNPSLELDINLEHKMIYLSDGFKMGFEIPEGRRQAFLTGKWDAMTPLRENEAKIKEAEARIPYLHFK